MSTNPMTQEQLDAIQAREANAAGGPWAVEGPAQCSPNETFTVYPAEGGGALAYVQPSWKDAEFIAHARTDIPALLAEVERLRELTTVDDDMVERGGQAMMLQASSWNTADKWDRFPEVARESWRNTARVVLDAALGTGEDA